MLSREVAAGIVYRVLRKMYDLLASWQDGIYFRKAKKDTLQRTPAVPLKQEMLFSIYRSDFFPYVRSSGWPNFLDMSSCILGPNFNLSTHTMRKHLATILTYRADRPKYVNGVFLHPILAKIYQ